MFSPKTVKTQLLQSSAAKIINFLSQDLQQSYCSRKIFRKPKKLIKNPKQNSSSRFTDHIQMRNNFKQWFSKMNESKMQTSRSKEKDLIIIDSDRTQNKNDGAQRLYQVYTTLRSDQKIVKKTFEEPQTMFLKSKRQEIKFSLKQIEKMRSQSQCSKRMLKARQFQILLGDRSDTSVGHQRVPSRGDKYFAKTPKSQRKIRIQTETVETPGVKLYEKYLERCPTTPLSSSRGLGLSYSSRSKARKIWQTIGLNDWTNIS